MIEESRVYRTALMGIGTAMAVIVIAGIALAWVLDGGAGAVAAAIGGGIATLAGLATPATMLMARGRSAAAFAALVAGTWLGKMAVILGVVAVLSRVQGFHREAFGWTLMAGVVASLAVDVWAVRSARVPYATPDSKSPER